MIEPIKPTRVVWMSRHSPTLSQLTELGRIYPQHELIFDTRAFDSADQIVQRFKEVKGDELVVVAPWSVIRAIIKAGVRPIHAEMQQVPCDGPDAEVIVQGTRRRCYKFVSFSRCTSVALTLEPL
jgi:hypothetical protein